MKMKTAKELVSAWPNTDEVLKGGKYGPITDGEWKVPFQIGLGKNDEGCVAIAATYHDGTIIADAKSNAAAVVVGNAVLRDVVNQLIKSKEKLKLYRKDHSGEYIGGVEYSDLQLSNLESLATATEWLTKQDGR